MAWALVKTFVDYVSFIEFELKHLSAGFAIWCCCLFSILTTLVLSAACVAQLDSLGSLSCDSMAVAPLVLPLITEIFCSGLEDKWHAVWTTWQGLWKLSRESWTVEVTLVFDVRPGNCLMKDGAICCCRVPRFPEVYDEHLPRTARKYKKLC